MNNYLPASRLQQDGRKLKYVTKYSELLSQLHDGDTVFALFDRGTYLVTPIIRNSEDFDQVRSILTGRNSPQFIGLFAVQEYEGDEDDPFAYPGR